MLHILLSKGEETRENRKNKGKKGNAKTVVTTATAVALTSNLPSEVMTKDREKVSAASALSVNYEVLVACQKAAPKGSPLSNTLFQMIATLKSDGPDGFAVSSNETPTAKKLLSILKILRVKTDKPFF